MNNELLQKFPERMIFATHPIDKRLIGIQIGEPGFFPILSRKSAAELNAPSVEPRHVEAALAGSMFGWDARAADPTNPIYGTASSRKALGEHLDEIRGTSALDGTAADTYAKAVRAALDGGNEPVLKLWLATCGNPDHGQDPEQTFWLAPGNVWVHVASTEEASIVVREFCTLYDLGGGNWAGGEIRDSADQVIGKISYNGRFWPADSAVAKASSPSMR